MRSNIEGYSQEVTLDLGLNYIDLVILRCFVDFKESGKLPKITIDNEDYFGLNPKMISDELPSLGIQKNAMFKRLQKLCNKKMLKRKNYVFESSKIFYALGPNYVQLLNCKYQNKIYKNNTLNSETNSYYSSQNYSNNFDYKPFNSSLSNVALDKQPLDLNTNNISLNKNELDLNSYNNDINPQHIDFNKRAFDLNKRYMNLNQDAISSNSNDTDLNKHAFDFNQQNTDFNHKLVDFNQQDIDFNSKSLDLNPRGIDFNPQALDLNPKDIDFNPQAIDLNPNNIINILKIYINKYINKYLNKYLNINIQDNLNQLTQNHLAQIKALQNTKDGLSQAKTLPNSQNNSSKIKSLPNNPNSDDEAKKRFGGLCLANALWKFIKKFNPVSKTPDLDAWKKDFDLILEGDSPHYNSIFKAIHWVFNFNPDLSSKILNPSTLMENYENIAQQMDNYNKNKSPMKHLSNSISQEFEPSYDFNLVSGL